MSKNNGHTFAISNVTPATDPVQETNLKTAIEHILNGPVEACSAVVDRVVEPYGFHALFEALHRAYDEHRGLILSPDNIWLTITQGFAACVNQDPENYRHCFVSFAGKKELSVRRDDFVLGASGNDWRNCFPEFSARIKEYIGEKTHGLIISDFSTTGDIELAASEVALTDTVQSYFTYKVITKCGIPFVTLEGSPEDWEKLVEKALALKALGGLDWWLDKGIPVLEEFVAASRGKIVQEFWNYIYKGSEQSGGVTARGFLLRLLPYTKDWKGNWQRNPVLSNDNTGLDTSMLPQALSCVPFIWDYHGREYNYQFLAGHVAIAHDPATDALRAVVGWAVRPAPAA